MFGPDPIGAEAIGSLVASAWGLKPDSVEYAPIGYGSYHWYVSAGGSRWLVTADAIDERPLAAAYDLAHVLGEQFGFVRSPTARNEGGVALESDDWLITVWPWVAGRSGSFGEQQTPGDVAAIADCLRQLHDYAEVPEVSELVEEWDIPGRPMLLDVLGREAGNVSVGPYAVEMAERIDVNRSRLQAMLARFDGLVAKVRNEAEPVVTHGEPHVANVVHTEAGPVLIDWDTVRW
ncbi:MAG: phosphotransferase, partial [bacterium]|nr:phosphotransferase [bacterium]